MDMGGSTGLSNSTELGNQLIDPTDIYLLKLVHLNTGRELVGIEAGFIPAGLSFSPGGEYLSIISFRSFEAIRGRAQPETLRLIRASE